jgi:hypothetical protein
MLARVPLRIRLKADPHSAKAEVNRPADGPSRNERDHGASFALALADG